MKFTIGADPEFMILGKNNELRSAIGILPKKENAIAQGGHKYYFDNVLSEIAVKVARNQTDFLSNIRSSLKGLAKLVSPGKFTIRASANYPQKELSSLDARIASCNPECNVYTLQFVFPSDDDVDLIDGCYQFKNQFRSAGGHIHVGSKSLEDMEVKFNVIRMLDLFLAVPSLFLDNDTTSFARRKIYGQAGSHRPTEYGLEYRALGNFWLASPDLTCLVYDIVDFVLDFVDKKQHERFWSFNEDLLDEDDPSLAYSCFGYDVDALRKALNTSNKNLAEKFMIFIGNYMPDDLMKRIENLSEKPLPNPYDAWNL